MLFKLIDLDKTLLLFQPIDFDESLMSFEPVKLHVQALDETFPNLVRMILILDDTDTL